MHTHTAGYFARHEALVELAGRFAACLQGASFQVLSLGAGYDTLFWQLEEAGGFNISRYIEVDVAPVSSLREFPVAGGTCLLFCGCPGGG